MDASFDVGSGPALGTLEPVTAACGVEAGGVVIATGCDAGTVGNDKNGCELIWTG